MTHVHTVLVRLHDPQRAPEIASLMATMRGRVPGMTDLDVVVNELSDEPHGCHVALTTRFVDRVAYDGYRTHPAHTEVATVVRAAMATALTIDTTEPAYEEHPT